MLDWSALVTVYLVGAGPGDPGLLTVRGAELLARADVVVYDRLASPALLELARGRRADRGGQGARATVDLTQDEINAGARRRRAARPSDVVRLKGGDPFVFGRGGEEAEALRRGRRPVRGGARHHERDRRRRRTPASR